MENVPYFPVGSDKHPYFPHTNSYGLANKLEAGCYAYYHHNWWICATTTAEGSTDYYHQFQLHNWRFYWNLSPLPGNATMMKSVSCTLVCPWAVLLLKAHIYKGRFADNKSRGLFYEVELFCVLKVAIIPRTRFGSGWIVDCMVIV